MLASNKFLGQLRAASQPVTERQSGLADAKFLSRSEQISSEGRNSKCLGNGRNIDTGMESFSLDEVLSAGSSFESKTSGLAIKVAMLQIIRGK
ncbi:hypothetical protein chiPu_0003564 [Chiloscyllium punctatum]|uniref:Uncharacterized protein n=1 Tax=Chiloscyllium punctatum TaxID=137246 RepID=A0A401S4A2_CHIPU|nr:hypothetical protein [Chiloscyllium punctatum]